MALALVTGSSTGIGLATSISLARAGHTVVAAMRNLERSGEIRKIAEQEKLPIHLAKIDVDDDESVQKGFVKVVAEHGPSTFWSTTPESPAAASSRRRRSTCFVR